MSERVKEATRSARGNCKMTSPLIQKQFANACVVETTKKIVAEIDDDVFCVLVDESCDCSGKEQMAVVVRFVNDRGFVVERFIGIVHVKNTTAVALNGSLETLLSRFGLCISQIRGQGYDGENNMQGQFGGLKTLIQKENPQAYYVHCFAHQLQLALISMATKHKDVNCFFCEVSRLVNFLRSSNKRQALLQQKQVAHFANLIEQDLVETGRVLNQELSIARAGDTRWGSHFRTLSRLVDLFTPIIEMLEDLDDDGYSYGDSRLLSRAMQTFDFVFMLHLMVDILAVTNVALKELNDRFTPDNTELLHCIASLSPCSSFQDFDAKSLLRLARLYPNDFGDVSDKELIRHFQNYIESVRMDSNFSKLKGISDLSKTLVRTKKHKTYRFVYKLVKLALTLPVATASVERVFSGMKFVKNELRNRMSNPWLNDCLVPFVEKKVFSTIDEQDIITQFQGMCKRRIELHYD